MIHDRSRPAKAPPGRSPATALDLGNPFPALRRFVRGRRRGMCIAEPRRLSSTPATFEVTNPPVISGGVHRMARCAPGTPHPREHAHSPATLSERVRFDVDFTG
jgi:hypothetical protein